MGLRLNFHLLVQFGPYDVNMPIWDLLCFAQQLGLPLNLTTKICLYKEWRGKPCQQMMKKKDKINFIVYAYLL